MHPMHHRRNSKNVRRAAAMQQMPSLHSVVTLKVRVLQCVHEACHSAVTAPRIVAVMGGSHGGFERQSPASTVPLVNSSTGNSSAFKLPDEKGRKPRCRSHCSTMSPMGATACSHPTSSRSLSAITRMVWENSSWIGSSPLSLPGWRHHTKTATPPHPRRSLRW